MNRGHMTADHHGRTAGRATLLARAMDEILGTHRRAMAVSAFSEAACSADGQPWHREHHQPAGPLRVRPSPPAVWADAQHFSPGYPRMGRRRGER